MRESYGPAHAEGRPPRQVGWFTAACLLVSNIIGGGIFTTTGFLARDLGDPTLILSLWVVGALLALAGAMSYSELGAALPQAGGDYVYLRQSYGPLFGFLSGWASFTVGFGAAIAASSVSFASYFLRVMPLAEDTGSCCERIGACTRVVPHHRARGRGRRRRPAAAGAHDDQSHGHRHC